MGEIYKACKDLVKSKGFAVHINTPFCAKYAAKHGKCFECESKKGCIMLTLIMRVCARCVTHPGRFTPEDETRDIDLILDGKEDQVRFD